MLSDHEVLFFLDLFHLVMPRVDILYAQHQKRGTDAVGADRVTRSFVDSIGKIRGDVPSLCVKYSRTAAQPKRKSAPYLLQIVCEVCDTVIDNAKERYDFTGHLPAVILFDNTRFREFSKKLP